MDNVHVKVDVKVKVEDVKVQDVKGIDSINHLKHLQILTRSSDGWITLELKIKEPSSL